MSSSAPDEPRPPGAGGSRPAALLVVRVTPDDVGARVTVRHRVHDDPAASLTDVVGTLLSWEPAGRPDAVLRIERRDGTTVDVPLHDVVAAKVVPPPPARR